jgi:hypothetical protein
VAFAAIDDSGYASMHVINMLELSTSEREASPLEHRRKRARTAPSPKVSLKPSEAAVIEGLSL